MVSALLTFRDAFISCSLPPLIVYEDISDENENVLFFFCCPLFPTFFSDNPLIAAHLRVYRLAIS